MNLWQFGKKGDNGNPAPKAPTAAKPVGPAPNLQGIFNKGSAMIQGFKAAGGGSGKGNGTLPANAYKAYEQPATSEENYSPKAYRVQPGHHEDSANPSDLAENAIPHVPQPKPKPRADKALPQNVSELFPEQAVEDKSLGNPVALDNLIRSVDELLYENGNGKPAPEPQSIDNMFAPVNEPAPQPEQPQPEAYQPQSPAPEAYNPAPQPEAYNPPVEQSQPEAFTPPAAEEAVPDLSQFMAANSLEFVSTAKPEQPEAVAETAPPYDAPKVDESAFAPPPSEMAVPDPYDAGFEAPAVTNFSDFVPPVAPEVSAPEEALAPPPVTAEETPVSNEGFGDFDADSLLAELKASAPAAVETPAVAPVAVQAPAMVEAPAAPVVAEVAFVISDADLLPPGVTPVLDTTPVNYDASFEPDPAVAPVAMEDAYLPPATPENFEEAMAYEPASEAVYPEAAYEEAVYEAPVENYGPEANYVEQAATPEPLPLTHYTAEGFDEQPEPEAAEAAYTPEEFTQPAYATSPEFNPSPVPAYIANADPGDENDYSDSDYSDFEDSTDEADYESAAEEFPESETHPEAYDEESYEETAEEQQDEYYAEPFDNPYSDYNVIDGQPKYDLDAAPVMAAAPAPRRNPPQAPVQDFEARIILEESRFVKNSIDQLVDRYFTERSPDAKRYYQP